MKEESRYLSHCGQELPSQSAAETGRARQRPTGVTILACLQIFYGLVNSFFGIALMLPLVGFGTTEWTPEYAALPEPIRWLVTWGSVSELIIVGILSFVLLYGYLKGRGWAWSLGSGRAIFTLVIRLIELLGQSDMYVVPSILIDVLTVFYLARPHVRRFFGRSSKRAGG